MRLTDIQTVLVTGATGLVGSHVACQARELGLHVKALCRETANTTLLESWGTQIVTGHLNDESALAAACADVDAVIHCAARVGDWGPTALYREVNVEGTRRLIAAALNGGRLKRWVHISSLGVYPATDHFGTDETTAPGTRGIDGYTLTKVESEQLVLDAHHQRQLPAVILRPGFIYGPRDRTVLPRLMERLRHNKFAYLGNTDKLMNNTYVGNLCEAIWQALSHEDAVGMVYNIRDPRAVTKREFIETICDTAQLKVPTKIVPLPVARALSAIMETTWKLTRRKTAPLVNSARIKFLGLNLDFDISRAQNHLGYNPTTDFRQAMPTTVQSFLEENHS